ncbi:HAMP domain-containing sensor histidine kinase [Ramlibacter sp. AN1015]|uniref:sensor histidine kinase n=1 Tax=Ramlibacter sp. AN1015 TaxID=3133428 RepID=UPI0030BA37CD
MEHTQWERTLGRIARLLTTQGDLHAANPDANVPAALAMALPALGDCAWLDRRYSAKPPLVVASAQHPAAPALLECMPQLLGEAGLSADEFSHPSNEALRALGFTSLYCVPLRRGAGVFGRLVVCTLDADDSRQAGERRARTRELASLLACTFAAAQSGPQPQAQPHDGAGGAALPPARRARNEMLATLGHELRNPLAPIVLALELMERRAPDLLVSERRLIRRQVKHLATLLDDLLEAARIADGTLQLRPERIDLGAVLARALGTCMPRFAQGAPVHWTPPDEPLWVEGDPQRLEQVFARLLENAEKFTPANGQVWLRLSSSGDQVQVEVEDTGCGIAATMLPEVFEPFAQGEQSLHRPYGGLGLGLGIALGLVELHGGTLEVASAGPGCGSRFTVCLPRAAQASAPAGHESLLNVSTRRVARDWDSIPPACYVTPARAFSATQV